MAKEYYLKNSYPPLSGKTVIYKKMYEFIAGLDGLLIDVSKLQELTNQIVQYQKELLLINKRVKPVNFAVNTCSDGFQFEIEGELFCTLLAVRAKFHEVEPWAADIKEVQYYDGYTFDITFENDETQRVSFAKFILENDNPLINQYKDLSKLKNFTFDKYGIYWDNDMSISAEGLIKGNFTLVTE